MPELVNAGFVPWSPAQVMDARVKLGFEFPDLWNSYFDTGFGLVATSDKIYLFPGSEVLRGVNPETNLTSGGVLASVDYLRDSAVSFNRRPLGESLNKRLRQGDVVKNPLWFEFAGGSEERLGQYVETVFKLGKDKYGYDEMMGIYVPSDSQPIVRAVVLYGLGDRSYAGGNDRHLGNDNSRFVGVRGEAAEGGRQNSLEGVVREFGITDPSELRSALEMYRAIPKN